MTIPTKRLDGLNSTINPQRDHEVAAMRDGVSNKLRIEQILALLQTSDIPDAAVTLAKLAADARAASGHTFDDTTAQLGETDVQGAIEALAAIAPPLSMAKAPSEMERLTVSSIRVKPGTFRDEDDASNISIPSAIDITGISVGNNAHRHVLAGRDGSGDPAAVLSETIALPSGWQAFRRIGSIRTDGSGNVRNWVQHGDVFMLINPVTGVVNVTNQGTSEVTRTLPVPVDVRVLAVLDVAASNSEAFGVAVVGGDTNAYAPDLPQRESVSDATISARSDSSADAAAGSSEVQILTNASGQIKTRSSISSTNLNITVKGWIDTRGRDF